MIVYILNLPSNSHDDDRLEKIIYNRLQNCLQITPITVQCYSKLSAGFVSVNDNQIKNHLVENIKQMELDPVDHTCIISFSDNIELISYIVIDKTRAEKNVNLPKPDDILRQWIEICRTGKSSFCDQINSQFPNIYRIVSTSFDGLHGVMSNPNFLVSKFLAHVYVGADCRYLENLPNAIMKEQLREFICQSIGLIDVPALPLHIELNKYTNNACIIAADRVRQWIKKGSLSLDGKQIPIQENLACRLLLHQISDVDNDDEILRQDIFDGKAKVIERRGENLVLEISDKNIFDKCLKFGVLRIGTKLILRMENYIPLKDPEELEIDVDTWYQHDMTLYKPDIMQFITDINHPIFRYKWNANTWLQEFQKSRAQNPLNNVKSRHNYGLASDRTRHLLRMTVMLNTIGVIQKKSYLLNNEQIKLNLDPKLKTIVYNHDSLLQLGRRV